MHYPEKVGCYAANSDPPSDTAEVSVSHPNTQSSCNCEHLYSMMEAEPRQARQFKRLQNQGGVLSFQQSFA